MTRLERMEQICSDFEKRAQEEEAEAKRGGATKRQMEDMVASHALTWAHMLMEIDDERKRLQC